MMEWGFGGFLGEALLAVDSWACYLGAISLLCLISSNVGDSSCVEVYGWFSWPLACFLGRL